MLRPIINTYIVPTDGSRGNLSGLAAAVAFMFLIYIAGIIATYIQSRLLTRIGQNCLQAMREDLFNHMQSLPVRYYDGNTRGDLMSRFTNDIDNVGNMLSSSLISIFTAILTLAGTLALMLYTNWVLTLVTIVVVPLMLSVVKLISLKSSTYFGRQQAALGALNGYIEEAVTGQKVIKVFNHEDTVSEEFGILNEHLKNDQVWAQFYSGVMGPVMNCSSQICYTLTAVVGGLLAVLRGFDIGGLTVFLNYSRQFSRPINEIAMTTTTIFSALAGAERVQAVLEAKPEEADAVNAYVPSPMRGDVVMKDVCFGYNEDKLILKNIDLYAHPGQKIAFVGSTGAGKTTVMNLLPRFYDIQSGTITIDGVDIKQYKRSELRKNVTMVLQESHLFSGTIMENIRYGRLDATDEEVIEAAKTASADSFIRHLPNGYNTVIDADGSNLSQGQRQLLNIARAAAGAIAIKYNCQGAAIPAVTACASGSNAIGEAVRAIRHGYADAAVTGGSEAPITDCSVAGFINIKALSLAENPDEASLPFDKRRAGFVMGEGAAALILEEYEHAKKRGARILAEVTGYGSTCDAYHITAPRPDALGAARAMKEALSESGYTGDENIYVNAHGTGTPLNDSIETKAIKLSLGEKKAKDSLISSRMV